METRHIYKDWCTQYTVTLEEVLAESPQVWRDRLVSRGLIILRGLGPDLTDQEFHAVGEKFGKLWSAVDYVIASGYKDPTLKVQQHNTFPTSYFKTTNNYWKDKDMKYHADMAHVGDKSFPARALYMVKTAINGSGDTEWLNLESAWAQCTEEEKSQYTGVEVVQHNMYDPGNNQVTYPFIKTNPYNGIVSPRLNCYGTGRSWVHHVNKNGIEVEDLSKFMEDTYKLCESKKDTTYKHHWENGDMLIYDNWFSVHRRDPVSLQEGEADRLLKRLSFNIY
jgi:alpha-ketoglutarate-dependent taurine dioxygenase